MSYNTKGTLNVGRTAYADGKAVVTSLNGDNRDSTTLGFSIDSYTTDQLFEMISVLPVSNFIPVTGLISTSGYTVNFTVINEALLSGNYLKLPITTINLTDIKASPENTTFYVYVTMNQGLAQYLITDTVIAESGTSAYNNFWIGTVTTGASSITSTNIISRARLDVFSPSSASAGSSFPVSTGLPSQTGTISW